MDHINDAVVLVILIAGMAFSLRWKKLTTAAAITGGILGWLIYAGAGYTGLALLTAFFILGTAATSWKKNEKHISAPNPPRLPDASTGLSTKPPDLPANSNLPHEGSGYQPTRHAGQVFANAGVAAIAGLLMVWCPPWRPLLEIMMAASLAAAAADTLSSELGMVYGRRFYNILTGRQDQKGLDGVISIEGLLFGLAGSVIIALIALLDAPGNQLLYVAAGHAWYTRFWIILLAGTIGNLVDSLLGATLERRHLISNDIVNFGNTLAAALTAWALAAWL